MESGDDASYSSEGGRDTFIHRAVTVNKLFYEDKEGSIEMNNKSNEVMIFRYAGTSKRIGDSWMVDECFDSIPSVTSTESPIFAAEERIRSAIVNRISNRLMFDNEKLSVVCVGGPASGKSYLLFGNVCERQDGVVQAFLRNIFQSPRIACSAVFVQMYIIIEERIIDLLDPSSGSFYHSKDSLAYSKVLGSVVVPTATLFAASASEGLDYVFLGLQAASIIVSQETEHFNSPQLVLAIDVMSQEFNRIARASFVEVSGLCVPRVTSSTVDRFSGVASTYVSSRTLFGCVDSSVLDPIPDDSVNQKVSAAATVAAARERAPLVPPVQDFEKSALTYILQDTLFKRPSCVAVACLRPGEAHFEDNAVALEFLDQLESSSSIEEERGGHGAMHLDEVSDALREECIDALEIWRQYAETGFRSRGSAMSIPAGLNGLIEDAEQDETEALSAATAHLRALYLKKAAYLAKMSIAYRLAADAGDGAEMALALHKLMNTSTTARLVGSFQEIPNSIAENQVTFDVLSRMFETTSSGVLEKSDTAIAVPLLELTLEWLALRGLGHQVPTPPSTTKEETQGSGGCVLHSYLSELTDRPNRPYLVPLFPSGSSAEHTTRLYIPPGRCVVRGCRRSFFREDLDWADTEDIAPLAATQTTAETATAMRTSGGVSVASVKTDRGGKGKLVADEEPNNEGFHYIPHLLYPGHLSFEDADAYIFLKSLLNIMPISHEDWEQLELPKQMENESLPMTVEDVKKVTAKIISKYRLSVYRMNGPYLYPLHCRFEMRRDVELRVIPCVISKDRKLVAQVYVNGKLVTNESTLRDGDLLQLGPGRYFQVVIPLLKREDNKLETDGPVGTAEEEEECEGDKEEDKIRLQIFGFIQTRGRFVDEGDNPKLVGGRSRLTAWEACVLRCYGEVLCVELVRSEEERRHTLHLEVDREYSRIAKFSERTALMDLKTFTLSAEEGWELFHRTDVTERVRLCCVIAAATLISAWADSMRRNVSFSVRLRLVGDLKAEHFTQGMVSTFVQRSLLSNEKKKIGKKNLIPQSARHHRQSVSSDDFHPFEEVKWAVEVIGSSLGAESGQWLWTYALFLERFVLLKNMVRDFFRCRCRVRVLEDLYPSEAADPFCDMLEDELLGVGFLYLQSLLYLVDIDAHEIGLVSFLGQRVGFVSVKVRTWIDKVETDPSYISVDEFLDLNQYLDKTMCIRFMIRSLGDLPPRLCCSNFLRFKFFYHRTYYSTPRYPGAGSNQNLNHIIYVENKITPDFISFLRSGSLELEVYGKKRSLKIHKGNAVSYLRSKRVGEGLNKFLPSRLAKENDETANAASVTHVHRRGSTNSGRVESLEKQVQRMKVKIEKLVSEVLKIEKTAAAEKNATEESMRLLQQSHAHAMDEERAKSSQLRAQLDSAQEQIASLSLKLEEKDEAGDSSAGQYNEGRVVAKRTRVSSFSNKKEKSSYKATTRIMKYFAGDFDAQGSPKHVDGGAEATSFWQKPPRTSASNSPRRTSVSWVGGLYSTIVGVASASVTSGATDDSSVSNKRTGMSHLIKMS